MRLYLQKPLAALRSHAKKLLYMAYRLCQIFRNWLKLLYDKVTKINNNHNKNHPQKLPETGLPGGPCIITIRETDYVHVTCRHEYRVTPGVTLGVTAHLILLLSRSNASVEHCPTSNHEAVLPLLKCTRTQMSIMDSPSNHHLIF